MTTECRSRFYGTRMGLSFVSSSLIENTPMKWTEGVTKHCYVHTECNFFNSSYPTSFCFLLGLLLVPRTYTNTTLQTRIQMNGVNDWTFNLVTLLVSEKFIYIPTLKCLIPLPQLPPVYSHIYNQGLILPCPTSIT